MTIRVPCWPLDKGSLPAALRVLRTMRDTLGILAACALACSTPTLAQEAKITASNADNGDSFGSDVAIDGDTMVVGSISEDSATTGINGDETDNSADRAGAAYVFTWNGSSWVQQAYLKASNAEALEVFGTSVDISGDTIVVGAPWEDSAATDVNGNQTDNSASRAGAAYVFVRDGGVWTQEAYLKADNAEAEDFFGAEVAIYEDVIVVGATGEDGLENRGSRSGAVYVFERIDGIWLQRAYLKGFSDPDSFDFGANDRFGVTVDIDDETIVVGAFGDDSLASGVNGDPSPNVASNVGAAYVFVRDAGEWVQQAYLKSSNPEEDDGFGFAVAVHADTIVVRAAEEDSSATGIDGDETDNSSTDSGAVYVFRRNGTTWSQEAYVKASNTESEDRFSHSVAVHNGTMLIGATGEDSSARGIDGDQADNSFSDPGAAYLFVRPDATWSQKSYVKSLNTSSNDRFGFRAAVSKDIAVVSESLADLGSGLDNAGAVYAYRILRPFVTDLAINPADPVAGDMVSLSGVARLPATLAANLTNAEYRLNQATWQPMSAVDGLFDGDMEAIEAMVDGADISLGTHQLCVRAFDDQGNVSIPACLTVGEICDNGVDDDGDGLVDTEDEDCPAASTGLRVACLHDPIYPSSIGDQVTITATAIDADGNALTADALEIWVDDRSGPTAETQNQPSLTHQFQAGDETFSYACHATRNGQDGTPETHFSRWRTVDVGLPEMPSFPAIPVLFHGPLNEKLDIVFFFDQDEYTGFEDPAFHQDIEVLLRDGLFTIPWFVDFQHFFNFWIGVLPGNSGPDPNDNDPSNGIRCLRQAPSPFGAPGSGGYAAIYAFADAGAIVHRTNCRDNAGSPGVFTIEGDTSPQVFGHEMGHRPFGLADEYCCAAFGGYYRNEPFPNLYGTEANCQSFALARGFDPLQCRSFVDTRPMTPEDWWIWEPSSVARDLMQQNGQYKVGDSEIDRMIWMIERCFSGEC